MPYVRRPQLAWVGTHTSKHFGSLVVNSSGKLIVQPPASCPLASTSNTNQMDVYQPYFSTICAADIHERIWIYECRTEALRRRISAF